uniref:Globin family profile domain-containing protein n=2 Tax=Panagrolaimus sp. JU765 TaxID=591449 RepID=A0AC34PWL4_9BILA
MGNSGSTATNPTVQLIRRNESFGSSPKKFQKANTQLLLEVDGNSKANTQLLLEVDGNSKNGSFGSSDFLLHDKYVRRRSSGKKSNRSQSLEQRSIMNGSHSPSSSQSSSNSYLNAIVTEKGCLRQSTQPKFQISGDLNPHQVNLVKRTWKQTLKSANEDENEMACRLLLRIFQLDHRNQVLFGLADIPQAELLNNQLFLKHVKAIEPTLSSVMSHPANATNLSKYLQQLGGRHVQYTGVTYKCSYWKV